MAHDLRRVSLPSQPLRGSDIHIWHAALSGSTDELAEFHSQLAADEKARADRFFFERDRNRYIVGRGTLRTLLASYLDTEASQISFKYGPQRKPELATPSGERALQFNLAHSNDWAAYAFGWDRPLGIDLEHIRPVADVDDLVQRFFTARESALIRSLSGDEKWKTFFQIWTCKEALLKAHGSGLTTALDQFEIALDAKANPTVIPVGEDSEGLAVWQLVILDLVPGYTSALALQANSRTLTVRSFAF